MKPTIWGWRCTFFLTGGMASISLALWSLYQTSDIIKELNEPEVPYHNRRRDKPIEET
jgi:predicted MFS family arabinose efflux permease